MRVELLIALLMTVVLVTGALTVNSAFTANKPAVKRGEIDAAEIIYLCPNCRSYIHGWRPNCPLCNSSLTGVRPYEDKRTSLSDKNPATPTTSEQAPPSETRPCPACGAILPVESVLCPTCGRRFPDAKKPAGTGIIKPQ